MILVEPRGSRYETVEAAVSSEEHLLERISTLENKLGRLTEKLERSLDLLLRQAQNSYFDRALVKALVSLLTADGIVQSEKLEQLWNSRCQKDAEEQEESSRREQLRVKVLASFHGKDLAVFEQTINEGFLFIEDQQLPRGIRSLEKAAEIAPDNAFLLSFLGEHFFKTGKTRRAQEYLARVHELSPGDVRVSLLLGLTCADQGDAEKAKELLRIATRRGGPSFAAHFGLGHLFVAEENWKKALREFKRALASKPSPEAHYALACLYYQLSQDTLATRHLRRALEMDARYTEALYVLGLVYQRAGEERLAKEAFESAGNTDPTLASNGTRRRRQTKGTAALVPLFQSPASSSRKLISGGDRRLAEALRRDALGAFKVSDLDCA